MLLGKVKRMEEAFLNLQSKKENIYLHRSTDNWSKSVVILRKHKENPTKPENL